MQSWVYLTLPEVKHAPETEKEFPRNLLILPPPGGKKIHFPIQVHPLPPHAPQNSPDDWKHPKHCSLLAENSAQSHSWHHRLRTGPANIAKRPRNLCEIRLHTVTDRKEKYQWLNKTLWGILLESTIKTYYALPDSTAVSLHLTSSAGFVTSSKMTYNEASFTTGQQRNRSSVPAASHQH